MKITLFSWKKEVENQKLANQQEMLTVLYEIKENLAIHETKIDNLEYRIENLENKVFKIN